MTCSTRSPGQPRIAVIGAGIIGASCAAALAEAGARVDVLERAGHPATGSTGWSVAGVRVQFTEEVNVRLSWTSIQSYATFAERYGVDVGYRPIGYLFLVPDQDWAAHLDGVEIQRRVGAPIQVLDPATAQEYVPFVADGLAGLHGVDGATGHDGVSEATAASVDETAGSASSGTSDSIVGATYGPADGIVDPVAVTRAYLDRARAHHASVHYDAPVHLVQARGQGWRVVCGQQRLDVDVVVNAAGAWAGEVARLAGLSVPVVPVRRSVFATAPLPRRAPPSGGKPAAVWRAATHHPGGRHAGGPYADYPQHDSGRPRDIGTVPLTVDLTTGFFLRGGDPDDRLVYGGSRPDQPAGFHVGLDWQWHAQLRTWGTARFPWLAPLAVDADASWFAYYETTPDHNPVLGQHPEAPSWIDAAGFSGHGVQQAPAVGQLVAEEVYAGRASSIDIDALRLDRFRRSSHHLERHII